MALLCCCSLTATVKGGWERCTRTAQQYLGQKHSRAITGDHWLLLSFEISNTRLPRLTLDSLCSPAQADLLLAIPLPPSLSYQDYRTNHQPWLDFLQNARHSALHWSQSRFPRENGQLLMLCFQWTLFRFLDPNFNCSSQNLPLVIFWVCLRRGQRLAEPKLNIWSTQTVWAPLHKHCYVLSPDVSVCPALTASFRGKRAQKWPLKSKSSVSIFCFSQVHENAAQFLFSKAMWSNSRILPEILGNLFIEVISWSNPLIVE